MGVLVGGSKGRQEPAQYIAPEEKKSLLAELGQRSGQAIEALGLLLDTPGAIARGLLAGDPASGFSFDRDRRVTGEELLASYGLKPENPYLSTASGFAAELVTDPLAYATLPFSSGGRAYQAASKAGLMKYAPTVASLKTGSDATRAGKFTLNAIKEAGLKPTTAVVQTRPLVGPRLASMTTTLDEVVKEAPDPIDALRKVRDALGDTPYASVKDERLGGLFGFRNPLTGEGWAYNPNKFAGKVDDLTNLNLAENVADVLDKTGQRIAWSYPARLASSLFDKTVGGQIKTADQIYAMRRSQAEQMALESGRSEAVQHAMKLGQMQIPDAIANSTGVSNFYSAEGGDALLRLVEGVPTAADNQLVSGVPGLQHWIDGWKTIAQSKLDAAKDMGLSARALQDPFNLGFSPRSAPELDFSDMAGGGGGLHHSLYAAFINNQQARNRALFVPGGTAQLQEISLDPRVRAFMKGASDESEIEVGAHIANLINNPAVDAEQGADIARVFSRLGKDVPDDVPVFGTHPIIEQIGYIINENLRVANADSALEQLADAAVNMRYRRIPGGRHVSLNTAFTKIAEELGFNIKSPEARQQLQSRVAKALFAPGTDPASLKLKNLSVPEEAVRRVLAVNAFYTSPESQKQVVGLLDKYTTLFKNSVLAWPSRFARDAYSNLFSVWLENGNAEETLKGFWAASKVLNDDWAELPDYFRRMPRYASIADDNQLINQVKLDVGRTGVLSGLATTDLLSASRRGDIGQFVPGSTPISVARSMQPLVPQPGIPLAQRAKDFVTIKGVNTTYETRNPIYNAANMLGDTIDSSGRLAGFFSLMRDGVAPEESARRMMSALVDYSSLTPFERNVMRRIFPWWAYNSRIGKYAVQHLMQAPGGRYGQTIRAINDAQATTDESYIPTALRQQFAIRVPDAITGNTGTRTYIDNIDLPAVDVLNMVRLGYQPDIPGSILQTGQNTLGQLLQQANPLFRSAAELATGQDFFSKRPLEQAETPLDRIYQAATGDKFQRINPLLRAGLSNAAAVVPLAPRTISAVAQLVDPRIQNMTYKVGKTLVNNLTGVSVANVDPKYETLDALSKLRAQQSPYSREFTQSYIPAELLPRLPLAVQQAEALRKELNRDLRTQYEMQGVGR